MPKVEIDSVYIETDANDVVVSVNIDGSWVEVIRTCRDGLISHNVTSVGILHAKRRRELNATPKWAMGHA